MVRVFCALFWAPCVMCLSWGPCVMCSVLCSGVPLCSVLGFVGNVLCALFWSPCVCVLCTLYPVLGSVCHVLCAVFRNPCVLCSVLCSGVSVFHAVLTIWAVELSGLVTAVLTLRDPVAGVIDGQAFPAVALKLVLGTPRGRRCNTQNRRG